MPETDIFILQTALAYSIMANIILAIVYLYSAFFRKVKRVIFDADRNKVYFWKVKFDKRDNLYKLNKYPIEKEDIEVRFWIIKNGTLNKVSLTNYNGIPIYSMEEVRNFLTNKLTLELWKGSLTEYLIYIVMGAFIGLFIGVLIGIYIPVHKA
jgi:hypothetical protein